MINISKTSILSILSQFAVMQLGLALTGLVRNKVIALRLGPAEFGEFTQIIMVISMISTIVSFGMGVGLSRNIAKYQSVKDRQKFLSSANGLVFGATLISLFLTLPLLASGKLFELAAIQRSPGTLAALVILIAAIPLEGLKNNYLSFLQGVLDVHGMVTRRSVAVLLATILAVPIVWFYGLIGAAIQFILLSGFVMVVLGWRCHKLGYRPLVFQFEKRPLIMLSSFGLASLTSAFAQGFADTAIRATLIKTAGTAANGLLQAPYLLAHTVKEIVLGSIGSFCLATLHQTDRTQMSESVGKLLRVVVPLGASVLGLLGAFGYPLLALLYSEDFTAGVVFFPFLLCADLLLVFVWVIGSPLLTFGDRFLWLVLELLYAGTRWLMAYLLLERVGSLAVVIAYLAAVFLHLLCILYVFIKRYNLSLSMNELNNLLVGVVFVGILSIIGMKFGNSSYLWLATMPFWLIYTVHHFREYLPDKAKTV